MSEGLPVQEPAAHADCDRKPGHSGLCMKRCALTPGCTEPVGHRGRCTEGTFNQIGWADRSEPVTPSPTRTRPWDADYATAYGSLHEAVRAFLAGERNARYLRRLHAEIESELTGGRSHG